MNKKKHKAKIAIETALMALDDSYAELGQKGISHAQIKGIIVNLKEMLGDLEAGKVPVNRGLGRVIVDSWPIESSVGIKIIEAEQLYLASRNP